MASSAARGHNGNQDIRIVVIYNRHNPEGIACAMKFADQLNGDKERVVGKGFIVVIQAKRIAFYANLIFDRGRQNRCQFFGFTDCCNALDPIGPLQVADLLAKQRFNF